MKKILFLAVLCSISIANAKPKDANTQRRNNEDTCVYEFSRIYVNPQGYYLKLDIHSSSDLGLVGADQNVDLDGGQGGFQVGYEYKKLDGLYTNLKVEWNLGSLSGDGAQSRMIHDETAEARFGYNYTALQGDSLIASFYSGFGFNYKSLWKSAGPPNHMSYYNYYVPVGLMLEYLVDELIHVGFDFTWMPQVDSTVKISSIDGSRWVLHNKSGFSAELPLIFNFDSDCCCWDIRIVPFWKRLQDGSSIIQAQSINLGLPSQVWIYWGGRVDLGAAF